MVTPNKELIRAGRTETYIGLFFGNETRIGDNLQKNITSERHIVMYNFKNIQIILVTLKSFYKSIHFREHLLAAETMK